MVFPETSRDPIWLLTTLTRLAFGVLISYDAGLVAPDVALLALAVVCNMANNPAVSDRSLDNTKRSADRRCHRNVPNTGGIPMDCYLRRLGAFRRCAVHNFRPKQHSRHYKQPLRNDVLCHEWRFLDRYRRRHPHPVSRRQFPKLQHKRWAAIGTSLGHLRRRSRQHLGSCRGEDHPVAAGAQKVRAV